MERACMVVIGLLAVAEAEAITREFEEDGDDQGWHDLQRRSTE